MTDSPLRRAGRLIVAPFIFAVVLFWCLAMFCADADGLRGLWREVWNGR